MDSKPDWMKEQSSDSDILFSKTVKAGKRIYYIDVKRDRKGEFYISITESKRLKEQAEAGKPVFEKHKIFLYNEDLEKFQQAFGAAADFAREHSPQLNFTPDWGGPMEHYGDTGEESGDGRIEIDF